MSYPDVPYDHPHKNGIDYVTAEGLMAGYPDGKFKPERNLTRGQFATVLWRMAGRPASSPPTAPSNLEATAL